MGFNIHQYFDAHKYRLVGRWWFDYFYFCLAFFIYGLVEYPIVYFVTFILLIMLCGCCCSFGIYKYRKKLPGKFRFTLPLSLISLLTFSTLFFYAITSFRSDLMSYYYTDMSTSCSIDPSTLFSQTHITYGDTPYRPSIERLHEAYKQPPSARLDCSFGIWQSDLLRIDLIFAIHEHLKTLDTPRLYCVHELDVIYNKEWLESWIAHQPADLFYTQSKQRCVVLEQINHGVLCLKRPLSSRTLFFLKVYRLVLSSSYKRLMNGIIIYHRFIHHAILKWDDSHFSCDCSSDHLSDFFHFQGNSTHSKFENIASCASRFAP
mmetsp:Transcript_3483/g.5121  ORF Transcript_3483/g.5121 Transcript_3483/m.5121 type:complete len:319 (+) Transcript_3483:2-958(+)